MSITDRKPLPKGTPQDPIDRQMTRTAVEMLYGDEGLTALDDRRCPICKQPIGDFRDALSITEFGISGLCQACQDSIFDPRPNEVGPDDEAEREYPKDPKDDPAF